MRSWTDPIANVDIVEREKSLEKYLETYFNVYS